VTRARASDVLIIGGGAIGCAIARALAARGAAVLVVERNQPGSGATHAAGGMLSPIAEAGRPGPFLELALRSFDAFPAFAQAVREESGVDPEYRRGGKLRVALDAEEAVRLTEAHAWRAAAGLGVSLLDGTAARALEPGLSADIVAGLAIDADHQVNSRTLSRGLWVAAERAGARFRLGVAVERLLVDRGAVRGVRLADGGQLAADVVVCAAGAWSSELKGLPRALPVRPVFGEIVALGADWHGTRVLASEACYMIPRPGGRLLVGATMENAGFRAQPTAGGVALLLAAALRVVPGLGLATLEEAWSGLRPGTPDGLPILGPDPAVRGLYYATGHFRNGILLTPVTAELTAALVAGDAPPLDPAPFSATRFAEVPL
jgi:glycine oxidase